MLDGLFSPWPCYCEEEKQSVLAVLDSNRVNYWTGNETRTFENEFAAFCEAEFAIAVANGSVALDLIFKTLALPEGAEVIVTSRTFFASVSAIVLAGLTPVFADVDRDSQNITADTVRPLISEKTAAVLCVHLAGWPCDMPSLMDLANEHKLIIIEDCAQAHGARVAGQPVGSFGHLSAWSFCQDKIMTTGGEGGMVTTNSKDLWRQAWEFKDHGKSYQAVYERAHPQGFRWLHESFGTNWRMTEMQAAIGRVQLTKMPHWQQRREQNARQILDAARQLSGLRVPSLPAQVTHAWYKCYVFVEPDQLQPGWHRDRIMQSINDRGVPCFSGSCSEVYLEKAFDQTSFRPANRLKNARQLGETSLMFLVHPSLKAEEIKKTTETLEQVMREASR
ncbi:DegT/DnrJ/EryC1/StrS family aminotransferase [Bowmanella dokdonensis]|uniref:DegT/DnrJ/EryC1/StrS aminotransferase family protein n=1 Tax=Bowmanella dokdonensis TaxID=751969 RepID=A0A939DLR2_9ALTE|nr:DegT/DnrJ/EryC1/StrS aminotransferase family protein [Bowmanella dokdonensis]MBN7825078.1 DegT/DnrJ/EryC1/StrS aminotransferase family protein [Bowmanella dokdonensis]